MKEIEISIPLGRELDAAVVRAAAAKALGVKEDSVGECRVTRRSIDARKDVLSLNTMMCPMLPKS